MNYKQATRTAYDKYPDEFEKSFEKYFKKHAKSDAKEFNSQLMGKKVLDAGAGPGNHAKYFQKLGADVTCIDISTKMVQLCRKKGLKAKVMNIEKLKFAKESFDGIWAYTSLLHLPKKKMHAALKELKKVLKPNGIIFIALLEGKTQGFDVHPKYPKAKRWFSYYTNKEAQKVIGKVFTIKTISKKSVRGNTRHYTTLTYTAVKSDNV